VEYEAMERRCGDGGGAELAKCSSDLRKLDERALLSARRQPAVVHHPITLRRRCPARALL
jgi:hypothetical protein